METTTCVHLFYLVNLCPFQSWKMWKCPAEAMVLVIQKMLKELRQMTPQELHLLDLQAQHIATWISWIIPSSFVKHDPLKSHDQSSDFPLELQFMGVSQSCDRPIRRPFIPNFGWLFSGYSPPNLDGSQLGFVWKSCQIPIVIRCHKFPPWKLLIGGSSFSETLLHVWICLETSKTTCSMALPVAGSHCGALELFGGVEFGSAPGGCGGGLSGRLW